MKKAESLYVHFPYCRHLCNYCDFYRSKQIPQAQVLNEFHQLLNNSWLLHQDFLQKNNFSFGDLETVYIGGGTPSLWGKDGAEFFRGLIKNLSFKNDYEFTMEVNPGGWSAIDLEAWKETGVNRFSIGLQSLNPEFLTLLDRVHSIDESYETLEYFYTEKANFSVDLMLGLPFSQNKRDILKELNEVLKYNPQHFSIYILTVKENYPHFKDLPSDEYIESEYHQVSQFLQENGFNHYEVSNFAREGKESQHNLKYWRGETVAALGKSATGYLKLDRDQGLRYRWSTQNESFKTEFLQAEEVMLERIYLNLRTMYGVQFDELAGENCQKFRALAQQWQASGLAKISDNWVKLLPKGYLVMDSLMDQVFSHGVIE